MSTTPALKDPGGNTATSLKDKTEMVGRASFPPLPVEPIGLPPHQEVTGHHRVDEDRVRRALFDQPQKKAP